MNNCYVYKHIRLDNNKLFYIGIGTGSNYKRAYTKHGRNIFWKRVVNKTNYLIIIYKDNLTREEACKEEIRLIDLYNGRYLSNLTIGGEGIKNMSLYIKNKIREKLKGNKNSLGVKWKRKSVYTEKERTTLKNRLQNNKYANSLKVIDTITNHIYHSVKEASRLNNIPEITLTRWLKGITKNKSNLKYYYEHN